MTKHPSFFEDMSKMAGSFMQQGFSSAADMRQKFEQHVQDTIQHLVAKGDFVTRDEFEIVRAMAEKARLENEALTARLDAIEAGKSNAKTSKTKQKK